MGYRNIKKQKKLIFLFKLRILIFQCPGTTHITNFTRMPQLKLKKVSSVQCSDPFLAKKSAIMRGFCWWNSFLLQSMGTRRRGWLKNAMMSRGRSGRILDNYYYHYLELSSFCLSHLNIMHFDLFAQRDFELPHFWSCSISGLARLFHIYPQNS